ncbi:hypothetical protein WJT86_10170 [Microvirga sp. W0021]|uniref:CTP synthetase n=1 Tax=Hohaiivirga grylli TaxID=3133970 RepID=A0ABV0BM71_9HYPH
MLKLGILIWILAAVVLAGCFVTVVLLVPQLEVNAMQHIPLVALAGALVAILPSWMIARSILKP